ncbi:MULTISPECIES: molybdopterin-dependent oxidoreductase [unclassified Colwellia]|uniref:molybdopterin-dependent oxidoreductase n=1 Tax=unclassified Colwellia TaxID=196834 RepID=UPI0015F58F97|nr:MULTISPECIES: molybdopterin-dependent oxidoreductase [unclassified Colwellia]MBA6356987.1 molybdopterin-dependent oxidoreductase [Colwellia sp. BRX8-3]MBA6361001.1 molybdopterin-dependent oxidoreductase [Colwellia sp. BRX8-6]MBA6367063.1 molybdopterin-dependent oxidoreductase [Colwellia sp. BRX8-5]MBA6375752.1 molybdopterin-dependent oxidoreductase [Colwellia sp. BRX8-2]
MSDIKTHYRNCNICEAMCGLEIKYQDKHILSIKGDPKDPFSKGYNCPKATALEDFYNDEDRLKTPIRRTANGWEDISWDQAFTEIAEKLKGTQKEHGRDALAVYLGNPNAHNLGNALFLKPFMKALGTINRFSSASTDQMPHHVAANFMFGAGMLIPVPDIDRTDFMLIIGGNPVVSNGSMMTAPNVIGRMKAIQKRGGKIVVVDPRRTRTAKIADQHLFIRPEKDALLLLAMIHCVFTTNNVNLRHLADRVDGLDALENIANDYSPESVAKHVGIPASDIRTLTNDMTTADSAVCYSRMGASTQTFGGLCQWLTNVLNIITGNFDRAGGAMFPQPAFDLLRNHKKGYKSSFGKYKSRVRKLPFFNGEFPVATLAEEILTPGEGQIKSLITVAGNPVLSSPSGHKLADAFSGLDYMVAIDIYLNETTKHANIILPATTGLENSHFDIFFNSFSVRNTVKYSKPLFEPADYQRTDWQILKELAARMTDTDLDEYTPEMILDMELQKGPYGKQGMSLEKLIDNPHGIDIGPLMPCIEARIKTEQGSVNLVPQLYINDLPRLQNVIIHPARDINYPFDLIGRRLVKSHNTWTQNSERLIKGKNPCTLEVHPDDAKVLGISNGQSVMVSSMVGEVKIEVVITDDIQRGVVSMPQGWGHNQQGTQMSVAAKQPGVSINDLTDASRVDTLTGNAALNGTPVAINVA